MLY
ncbi:VIT family protein, partial [Chlamydia psittaci 84-8471/1]|jgi:hypothetical protein